MNDATPRDPLADKTTKPSKQPTKQAPSQQAAAAPEIALDQTPSRAGKLLQAQIFVPLARVDDPLLVTQISSVNMPLLHEQDRLILARLQSGIRNLPLADRMYRAGSGQMREVDSADGTLRWLIQRIASVEAAFLAKSGENAA